MNVNNRMRLPAEELYAEELKALRKNDSGKRPEGWLLSPVQVVEYIMGGSEVDGVVIAPKYFGKRAIIEVAVATLVTDRALLLLGIPGTAKTWVSEHLAAAISGNSKLIIQGTSGLPEEGLRYGWNYAQLIAKGPSMESLVPSPIYHGMENGSLVRIEELTRMPSDIQDALITVLSEKSLPIPELNTEIRAKRGFNVIATANDRDKGVNELSSALKRRFNTVKLPLPETFEEEVEIVMRRSEEQGLALDLPKESVSIEEIKRLVTIFRELRSGETIDGKQKLKIPTATLSPAEVISVVQNNKAIYTYFNGKDTRPAHFASSLIGAVVKDPAPDTLILEEYNENVIRYRKGWEEIYHSLKKALRDNSSR